MRRREFLRVLGGGLAAWPVAWPLAARAQPPAMPVIGFLNGASAAAYAGRVDAFLQSLSQAGYAVGRNVAIEYRWANGQTERLPALAKDLASRPVDLIVAGGNAAIQAARTATTTFPIVFSTSSDPVHVGFVTSLARPGSNLTGVTTLNVEVGAKRLELLHEVVPRAKAVAALINPTNPNAEILLRDLRAAAGALALQLHILRATSERDL